MATKFPSQFNVINELPNVMCDFICRMQNSMLMNIHWSKGQSETTFNVMLSDPTQQNLWRDF